jgi:DNA-binding transcriptional LysR family regulator
MIDLRGIDLNLLVSLDALLAESNVTRAAERLHLTQPAVSTQLARLRQIFGDPLLLPAETGRGMTRTARALELMTPLHAALKNLEAVVRHQSAFDPLSDMRRFAIAAHDNATAVLGMRLMERLPALAGPGVRVALKARKLYDEHFVFVQRKGHPRGTAPLDLDTYCTLDHVLVSTSGGSFHGFMDEHLDELGRERHVALSVQHFTLVPELLSKTDYVSTLPSRFAARYADRLDTFALPFDARGFTLYAAWHPRNQADPALVWLRETLAELAAQ